MKKRTILVTGANRGIGLAIVQGLAKSTDDLILLGCRNLEQGHKEADKIDGQVEACEVNLSTKEGLGKNIDAIKEKYGDIDVLINNGAILREGKMLEISDDDFVEALQVNNLAIFQLIRAFAPGMVKKGYGRIVNLSSGWGSFGEGLAGPFSYSFTKASLNAMTKLLAQELPLSVKVNSMCPGWVRTRMGGMAADRSPEEGAETAIWLASLPDDGPTGGFFRDNKPIEW